MKLYEIDQKIMELVDKETGELLDYEAFEQLQMEREGKIENMACWYKELAATAKAIREEELALSERRRVIENKADSLKEYLGKILNGEKFQTAKCAVGFRKSTSVAVDDYDACLAWAVENDAHCFRHKPPELDKTEIGKRLKAGDVIPGVSLAEKTSVSVK